MDASFDEDTPEKDFRKKVSAWNALSKNRKLSVAENLVRMHQNDIVDFFNALEKTVTRRIERIIVIPLHGRETECSSVAEAIAFLSSYDAASVVGKVYKYEIYIRYINGDKITADFTEKNAALEFLAKYK